MHRRTLAAGATLALAAGGALAATTTGSAQEPVPEPPAAPPAVQPAPTPPPVRLIARNADRPPRVVHRRARFTPWAQPTPSQVQTIIAYEAARAGVSAAALSGRIYCESNYLWYASNGQYQGLGQFASSTFWRGMSTIGSRKVQLASTSTRLRRVYERRRYSDGTTSRIRRGLMRQEVRKVVTGWIPSSPPMTHGWAQVRIMAQAMAGRSAVHDSEWECR